MSIRASYTPPHSGPGNDPATQVHALACNQTCHPLVHGLMPWPLGTLVRVRMVVFDCVPHLMETYQPPYLMQYITIIRALHYL